MAEAPVSVYNVYILEYYLYIKPAGLRSLAAVLLIALVLLPASAAAQASLQSGSGGLQPQAGAAQQSINTQNQIGTLQNNNGGSVLNQTTSRPLGVVSAPDQIQPEAVAVPSGTLKTEVSAEESGNSLPIILAVGLFCASLLGLYIVRRKPQNYDAENLRELNNIVAEKSAIKVIRPEPLPAAKPPKKKKQTRRNRKKAKNRQ